MVKLTEIVKSEHEQQVDIGYQYLQRGEFEKLHNAQTEDNSSNMYSDEELQETYKNITFIQPIATSK